MQSRPSTWIHFLVGIRLAWSHLQQTPLYWLLAGILVAGGMALGIQEKWADFFAPLCLSMFLTLPTAFWGWQAAAVGSAPAVREPLVSRSADEWVINLASVLVNGLAGGFLSILFSLASLLPRVAGSLAWQKGLLWTPHVLLAHTVSAAIGTAVGLLSGRRPAVGFVCTGGLWWLMMWFAERMGPTSPDPLLRVLQWDQLLQDASAEPLYAPLAAGYAAVTVLVLLIGIAGFAIMERRRLPASPVTPIRIAAWATAAVMAVVSFTLLTWDVRAAEAALTTAPPPLGSAVLDWNADEVILEVTHTSGRRLIRGPVRPAAVALSEQRFSPYVGRQGVVVPVHLLTGPGPYSLHAKVPDGWSLYGCSLVTPAPTGGVDCEGEEAESDWLVLLREGTVDESTSLLRAAHPSRAEAQDLFREVVEAGFREIGRPVPDILFSRIAGPRWLSPKLLAGPGLQADDPAVTTRQAAHGAATALTLYLVEQRHGDVESELVPLLATLDRLLFELGPIPIDPAERQRREGAVVEQALIRYKPLPGAESPGFNEWWIQVDKMLSTKQVTASTLWQAVSTIQGADDARKWPETVRSLGIWVGRP